MNKHKQTSAFVVRRPTIDQRYLVATKVKNWLIVLWIVSATCLTVNSQKVLGAGPANLIVNGSFEENLPGPVPSYGFFDNIIGDAIYGWEITAGNMDLVGPYWQASDGEFSVDLVGRVPGIIQQSFATVPSVDYVVVFDMATNPVITGPGLQELRVSAAGASEKFSIDPTGRTQENMGWGEVSWSFVANSTTTTLSFESISPSGANGPALDHVRVTAVPEPTGLLLVGLGVTAVLSLRQRRR